jgi:hypothetical protein
MESASYCPRPLAPAYAYHVYGEILNLKTSAGVHRFRALRFITGKVVQSIILFTK